MSSDSRFIVDEDGVRWDRVLCIKPQSNPHGRRHTIGITGLVAGDDGVLLLRLPGAITADFLLGAFESRSLLAALLGRISPLPEGLIWAKTPVHVQIAGGYVETTYADGTSTVEPEFEEEAVGESDSIDEQAESEEPQP
jgi:hypothetical protein